ncbi:MAG: ABC transporter permease [Acidimicrobiales bacterium]
MTTTTTPIDVDRLGPVAAGPVIRWLSGRALRRMRRLPSLFVPVILMPLFFVVAFTGSFDGVTRLDGFPTDELVNWIAAYSMLQGATMAGVGSAGVIATDLENGFLDRLLASPVPRMAILLGPLAYAATRALIPTTLVLLVAAAQGADMPGGPMGIVLVYAGTVGTSMVIGSLGLAVVLRIRRYQAISIVQMGAFLILFPSIGQVPLGLLTGWMSTAARVNPTTNVLRMTRQGFIGEVSWADTWPGLVVIAVGTVVFLTWARRELDRLAG